MFSLKDSTLTIVRGLLIGDAGIVPAGVPRRMLSHTNVAFDPAGKSAFIRGASSIPISIVIGTAEPKLDIDFSNGPELWAARNAVGGINSTIVVSLTLTRVGMVPTSFVFAGTWSNGGGLALDETNGSKPDKLSVMCLSAKQDLRSLYNEFA